MSEMSQKRATPTGGSRDPEDHPKRQRTITLEPEPRATPSEYVVVHRPTAEDIGRDGLKRSIALVLNHVGFESASSESMESFAETVETYMSGLVEHLKRNANSARREIPTPDDFEAVLQRHNVGIHTLEPHLQNPVSKRKRKPKYYNPVPQDFRPPETAHAFLGAELDGTRDKEEKGWIPASFPGFPSKHSYLHNPMELPDHDRQRKREEAQQAAKKGEQALRHIDRAAKLSQQKELKEVAARNSLSRQRHSQWESLMKSLLSSSGTSSGGATEIADHSTVINNGSKYLRKEVPKSARRGPPDVISSHG